MSPSPRTTPPGTSKESLSKTDTPAQVPAVKTTVLEDDDDKISWDDGDELVDPSEAKEPKTATPVALPKDAAHDSTTGPVSKTIESKSKAGERERPRGKLETTRSERDKRNIKSDFSQQKESSDPDEIVKQVGSLLIFSSILPSFSCTESFLPFSFCKLLLL